MQKYNPVLFTNLAEINHVAVTSISRSVHERKIYIRINSFYPIKGSSHTQRIYFTGSANSLIYRESLQSVSI